jgi:two-component system sensor histidine kinase SenX3
MAPLTFATAVMLAVLVVVAGLLAFRVSERQQQPAPPEPEPALPPGVGKVLAVLRSAAVVLDEADRVVRSSPAAHAMGIVKRQDVVHAPLVEMVRSVRRDGEIREGELTLPRGPLGAGVVVVHARVAPLGPKHVLLLVEDRTEARRVEAVRRDFVANVSHELKTPVGAMALLAETILEAADDPEAMRRFAHRMQAESDRLKHLVQDIIDLSRVQGGEPIEEPEPVTIDGPGGVVAEAVDRSRLMAEEDEIALEVGEPQGASGLQVLGDRGLLVTAVRNLVDNAIRYSEAGSRIGIGVRLVADVPASSGGRGGRGGHETAAAEIVEIAVTDQGIGIPEDEQARVFERFYRVDPARSRQTGGTGLGLSIVKHVAERHGGEVTLWSEPAHGSTFTLRLPRLATGTPRRDHENPVRGNGQARSVQS